MNQRKQEELTKFFEAIFEGTTGYIDIRTFVHTREEDKIKTIQKDHFFRKVKDIKDLVRALSNENFITFTSGLPPGRRPKRMKNRPAQKKISKW